MQAERHVAANPQTKPTDLGCESIYTYCCLLVDPMKLVSVSVCPSVHEMFFYFE